MGPGTQQRGKVNVENDVGEYRRQFEEYLEATLDSRQDCERDIDYADLRQWTAAEEAILRQRGQAVVTFDYIGEQVDYLTGMERDYRADPRAYPRTQQHEGAADACSDALRYVADKSDFQQTGSECFRSLLVAGTEAAVVEVEPKKDRYEIVIRGIPWDRFYYDPHSRRRDFKDATFMGIVVWLDKDEVVRMYSKGRDATGQFSPIGDGMDDAPAGWADQKRNRLRVCQHYYLVKGVWHQVHFTGDTILRDPRPVPFVDEDGEPVCPIEAQSAYIDRDNNRYGYVRRLIDPQNEVNHRRSKALHLLSSRQVIAEQGAVKDQKKAQKELKKPDGWVDVNPGALTEGRIQINTASDMASGQMTMYSEAVGKLNASGANSAMQGDVSGMSGVAVGKLQKGGSVQVGPLFDSQRAWKRRIYRQVWLRIKQFWDAPMWIRVTDDEKNLKWVGLNQPITVGQQLLEAAKGGDQEAAAMLRQAIAEKDPRMTQRLEGPEGIRNNVAEIDVDIILDESPDTLTVQEDQFKVMAELAKVYGPQAVPFKALVEMSSMPHKKRLLDMLSGGEEGGEEAAQMRQMEQQLQQMTMQATMAEQAARTAKLESEARKNNAQAEQTEMETQLVATIPDLTPNVNI
jgi:hypothetical protein